MFIMQRIHGPKLFLGKGYLNYQKYLAKKTNQKHKIQ